jgi:ribonuclease P protein component
MTLATIKKREDFVRASNSNLKYFSKNVIVIVQKIEEQDSIIDNETYHIGYVVTKRVGNAVIRNKIKRRLRHIIRDNYKTLMENGFHYVIIAKSNIKNSKFGDIERDVKFCLKNLSKKIKNDN